MGDFGVGREYEDGGVGKLLANDDCAVEPFGGMGRRHANVDDRQIGTLLSHELEELGAVRGTAGDLEAAILQQARQSLAQQQVVIGEDDPSGSRPVWLGWHARKYARRG